MVDSSCSKYSDSEDYKMKKPKSGEWDRLSELPDSLILKIISSLEMREVVHTSLISKRWKDLWTTIPCLNFDESYDWVSTRNFISRALSLYKGVQLWKFKIYFWEGFDKSLYAYLDMWVRFAIERKVEVMYVYLDTGPVYLLPQCVFSSPLISKLVLCGCELRNREKVKWDQLKKLRFKGTWLNETTINNILYGSPQLEVLDLELLENYENLTIRSNSLKKLSIKKNSDNTEFYLSNYKVLTVCASKLETLALYGDAYRKCSLIDVSSLTDVTLSFVEKWVPTIEMTLRQILPMIQSVEAVTISTCCLQVLRAMKGKYPFHPLSNVKRLDMSCPVDPHELVCYLEIFPKLEKLIIYWSTAHNNCIVISGDTLYRKEDVALNFDGEIFLESEASIFESLLLHLRTVEIGYYSYEASLFQFIEFLLKHAAVVEKIVIQQRKRAEPHDMIMVAQKVQSLQTSFPTVELSFCSF